MKKIGKTILSSIMALSIMGVGVKSVKAADGSVGVGMFKEKGSATAGAKVEAGIENLVLKNLKNDSSLFLDTNLTIINHPISKKEWNGGLEFDAALMYGFVPTKESADKLGIGLVVNYNSAGTHIEGDWVKSYKQFTAGFGVKVEMPLNDEFRATVLPSIMLGTDSNGDFIFRERLLTNLDYKLTKNLTLGGIFGLDGYTNSQSGDLSKGGAQVDLGLQLKLHQEGKDRVALKTVYSHIAKDDNKPYKSQLFGGLSFFF